MTFMLIVAETQTSGKREQLAESGSCHRVVFVLP